MNDLVALIVGIERYDQPGWDVAGPCANAVAVANWLLSIKTPPSNIHLFLAPGPDLEGAMSGLEVAGVRVCRQADFNTIDTFVRTGLSRERPADARLLVYWSGHGFSENDGTRVFICSDYTADQLRNRVYDGSGLCHTLHHSTDYQCFREQLFLADVCAVHSDLKFEVLKSAPKTPVTVARQVAFFATPEGRYARGDNGLGVFTRIALEVLGQYAGWPILDRFSNGMLAAFETAGQAPFRCDNFDDHTALRNRLVGTIPAAAGSALFHSLWSVLSTIPLDESVYRPHYRCTVSSLGNPRLEQAQGLSGMIGELASLCDTAGTGQLPYGLIEFLVRLSAEAELADPIGAWLKENAASQGHDQANARRKIAGERGQKVLIIEVKNDEQGQLAAFASFLRTRDLVPVFDVTLPAGAVAGWEAFQGRCSSLIGELSTAHEISEIQFLADPPLFHLPFHAIPTANGTLGEDFVVLVRYRERLRSKAPTVTRCWCDYAAKLRRSQPGSVRVLPIARPGTGPAAPIADEAGLCYTRFSVPSAPRSAEKQTLMRWLRAGAAYLSWSHEPQPDDDWGQIEACLVACLSGINTLDRFPDAFTDRRLRQHAAAQQATLLWDDPECHPFVIPRGIEIL